MGYDSSVGQVQRAGPVWRFHHIVETDEAARPCHLCRGPFLRDAEVWIDRIGNANVAHRACASQANRRAAAAEAT